MDGMVDMDKDETIRYMIDCTLATVEDLACKRSRSKSEFSRQKKMAQVTIDSARRLGIDLSKTRAQSVIDDGGNVDVWAMEFEVK